MESEDALMPASELCAFEILPGMYDTVLCLCTYLATHLFRSKLGSKHCWSWSEQLAKLARLGRRSIGICLL
jgi:hypothetical protein